MSLGSLDYYRSHVDTRSYCRAAAAAVGVSREGMAACASEQEVQHLDELLGLDGWSQEDIERLVVQPNRSVRPSKLRRSVLAWVSASRVKCRFVVVRYLTVTTYVRSEFRSLRHSHGVSERTRLGYVLRSLGQLHCLTGVKLT